MATSPKKRPAKRAKKTRARASDWRVQWVKFVNDEDCVAKVRETKDEYFIVDPMAIAYHNGILTLTPFGLMSKQPSFTVTKGNVLATADVRDAVYELYVASVKLSPIAKLAFDQLVTRSLQYITGAEVDAHVQVGPSDSDLISIDELDSKIRETLGHPPADFESPGGDTRSRSQVLDSLVELAEKSGKGKKLDS